MRDDRLRLLDALEQIELILKFSEPGREAFFRDIQMQSAILHRLALLGVPRPVCRISRSPS